MSQDSSYVYSASCQADSMEWAVVLVELNFNPEENQREDMLVAYLDYLKQAFSIQASAGVGKGHTSERNPGAKGVIDFWEGESGENYKVKAWANANFVAVLMIISPQNTEPNYSKSEFFLNSLTFPQKD